MQKLPRLWLARVRLTRCEEISSRANANDVFFCLLFSNDCCRCNFRSRRIERKFLKKLRKSIKRHFTLQWKFSEDCKERSWLHYECKKMFEYAIDTHRMVGMKMSALVRLRVYFKRWTFFFLLHFSMNELTPKIRYVSVSDIWDDSVRRKRLLSSSSRASNLSCCSLRRDRHV